MPSLPPELADVASFAQRSKNKALRSGDRDASIRHVVDIERDGRRIIRCECDHPETIITVVGAGVPALAATTVNLAMDAWGHSAPIDREPMNPITGKMWQFGDMDKIVKENAGIERGLIQESIHLVHFERSGEWMGGCVSYMHDREAGKIIWGDAEHWDGAIPEAKATELGQTLRIPRTLREAFAERPAVDILGKATTPPERALVMKMQRRWDRTFAEELDRSDDVVLVEARL